MDYEFKDEAKIELGESMSLPSAMKGALCEVCGELTLNIAILTTEGDLPDVPAPRYCQKCGHRLGDER